MKVTGILSISNATGLAYPFTEVLRNLADFCDNVIVGVDPNFPKDRAAINLINYPFEVIDSPWNRDNIDAGSEIALQMDNLVRHAEADCADWVVVLQADEFLHEKDFKFMRSLLESIPNNTTGISMERLYFWKDLNTIRKDWSADLVRVFRPGTYSFMADNTDKAGMFSGQVIPGRELKIGSFIYHYSRVADPEVISRRVRNLDGFFHEKDTLIPEDELPPYDFVAREHDHYAKAGFPKEVKGWFWEFTETHPRIVKELFSD